MEKPFPSLPGLQSSGTVALTISQLFRNIFGHVRYYLRIEKNRRAFYFFTPPRLSLLQSSDTGTPSNKFIIIL